MKRKFSLALLCMLFVLSSLISAYADDVIDGETPQGDDEEIIEELPDVTVSYRTHVQDYGWQEYVSDGALSGTTGESKRLEAVNITVSGNDDLGISYRTHVQNLGWTDWVSGGEMSGTSGKALRLEALQIELTGEAADQYDVYYRVHVQNMGWTAWATDGEKCGSEGLAYRLEGLQILISPKEETPELSGSATQKLFYIPAMTYKVHIQDIGWSSQISNGATAGTTGQKKRIEAMVVNVPDSAGLTVSYKCSIQNVGWTDWYDNGEVAGSTGKGLRMEAIALHLSGENSGLYDIYYRVHVQNLGWLGWACNGENAGSDGYDYRIEAIQIKLVLKGQKPSGYNGSASYEVKPEEETEEDETEEDETEQDETVDATIAEKIIAFGEQYIGTPYVLGGHSLTNGIDCSNFTRLCFASQGIALNNYSYTQINQGTVVSMEDCHKWKKGDLVFYNVHGSIGHVAIYIGDGYILHSSESMGGVCITPFHYNDNMPVAVRRIIPD